MRRSTMVLLAFAAIGLAGCYPDPFQNPGDWAMNASPLENTAQQVADPTELLQGHGDTTSQGVAAAAGVDLAIGGAAGTATGLQKPPPTISFSSGTGS
jgi:type IV pilus biogenesis protein CpaD/CtpE